MINLFNRAKSEQSTPSFADTRTLFNFQIETKTQINLTKKDLATIIGLLTAGTVLGLCLIVGGSQEIPPSDASASITSQEIDKTR